MILKDVFYRSHLQARVIADGVAESEAITLTDKDEVIIGDATIAWVKEIWLGDGAASANLNLTSGVASSPTPSVLQVETATLVAAGGITTNGSLTITISGTAPFFASPLVFSVPVTTAITLATGLGAAVRMHLQTVSGAAGDTLRSRYTVGGSGATITLTPTSGYVGNVDSALNIAIAGGLGVTAAPTSANTQSGAIGTILTNGPALDARGKPLPVSTITRLCKIKCLSGAVQVFLNGAVITYGTVVLTGGQSVTLPEPQNNLSFSPAGGGPAIIRIIYIGL